MRIDILEPGDAVKYLGRMLLGTSSAGVEVDHRVRLSCQTSLGKKIGLACEQYRLASRLRLFDRVVTPTALHGASSWTFTADLQGKLRTTQRKMFRMILGSGKQPIYLSIMLCKVVDRRNRHGFQ